MAARSLKQWKKIFDQSQENLDRTNRRMRHAKETWVLIQKLERDILILDTEHRRNELSIARRKITRILNRAEE